MRRPVLTICTAVGVLILLALGTWQVQRMQWKHDLIAAVEERAYGEAVPVDAVGDLPEYSHVEIQGGFVTDRVAHVFGTYDGEPGWFVFQPFKPDLGRQIVLVNRGFVADANRQDSYALPDAAALTGLVRNYDGREGAYSLLSIEPDEGERLYYDRKLPTLIAAFADLRGGNGDLTDTFETVYIDSTLPTDLPRGGTTRLEFSDRHLGYAITWYGLAAGLIAIYITMRRRG